jgi:hypothetical protein
VNRALLVAICAVLAGCGGGESGPESVVPKDATAYVSVDMRSPVAAALPHRAWVGDRAALFALDDEIALVLTADDEDAARAYAREPEVAFEWPAAGIVDGHLVLARTAGLVDAAREAADGEAYKTDEPEDLAAFVSAKRGADAGEALAHLGMPAGLTLLLPEGELEARARQDGEATVIDVDGVAPRPRGPALDAVPESARLAISDGDIGSLVLAARVAAPEMWTRIERRVGIDFERELIPHLAAGTFFVQENADDENARLVVDIRDQAAVRRAGFNVITVQRRRPRTTVWTGGAQEELSFGVDWPKRGFYATIENGRLAVDIGTTGGDSEFITDTARYRDAERLLGAPPALLLERDKDYVAAANRGETLRVAIVRR